MGLEWTKWDETLILNKNEWDIQKLIDIGTFDIYLGLFDGTKLDLIN